MTAEKLFYIQEVEIRYKNATPKNERPKITSSRDAYEIAKTAIGDLIDYKEAFFIILLNNSNEVLGISKISEGGITGTVVDVRLVFQLGLKTHAVGMILAHNHPSGTLKPSQADISLTKKLKDAGELLDIKVLDHLIVTTESYFSFADENQI
tara:strand:- start:747 stop:1202 length:456 start_codon:yes stop_codon:yes gene_type:complete